MHPLISLLISIVVIVFLVVKVKINPAAAMFLGALIMGISTGLGLMQTVSSITGGFGGTMTGLGFSVGFGIMMGQLIAATGAVQVIANKIVGFFGQKRSDYAMGATGFIVSVPVFYDVGFVLLTPIAKAVSKASNKHIAYFSGALCLGLGYAHTFVPPTPGPMTAAELAGVDLGLMIFWGVVIGLPTFFISMLIYQKLFLDRPGFLTEKDVNEDALNEIETDNALPTNAPSFGLSMIPILLPILLILMGTGATAILGKGNVPEIISFFADKSVAMFIGFIAAFCIALGRLSMDEIQKELNSCFAHVGSVLFITATGGALGSVIQASGVGDALVEVIGKLNMPVILFAWIVAALLKVAQGSGTVAMITAMTLVAPMLAITSVNPVFIAMAACSGSLCGAHVNDSAFWVTSNLSGLTTSGGLKVYSLPCLINAIVSLAIILLLGIIL